MGGDGKEQLSAELPALKAGGYIVRWVAIGPDGHHDVYTMVVQVHLHRRRWRACLAGDLTSPHPLVELDQLDDLAWLDG